MSKHHEKLHKSIIVNSTNHQKLSLDERLAAFDPGKHSGEVLQVKSVGLEKISNQSSKTLD
jgi:hypothetical protein